MILSAVFVALVSAIPLQPLAEASKAQEQVVTKEPETVVVNPEPVAVVEDVKPEPSVEVEKSNPSVEEPKPEAVIEDKKPEEIVQPAAAVASEDLSNNTEDKKDLETQSSVWGTHGWSAYQPWYHQPSYHHHSSLSGWRSYPRPYVSYSIPSIPSSVYWPNTYDYLW